MHAHELPGLPVHAHGGKDERRRLSTFHANDASTFRRVLADTHRKRDSATANRCVCTHIHAVRARTRPVDGCLSPYALSAFSSAHSRHASASAHSRCRM